MKWLFIPPRVFTTLSIGHCWLSCGLQICVWQTTMVIKTTSYQLQDVFYYYDRRHHYASSMWISKRWYHYDSLTRSKLIPETRPILNKDVLALLYVKAGVSNSNVFAFFLLQLLLAAAVHVSCASFMCVFCEVCYVCDMRLLSECVVRAFCVCD